MRLRNTAALLLALFIIGCTAQHGTKIEQEQIAQIEKGVTTEAEIREWFGKPTLTQTDTEGYRMVQYAYGEAKSNKEGYIPYVGGLFRKTESNYSTLALEIDENGVVKNYTVLEGESESKSVVEQVSD